MDIKDFRLEVVSSIQLSASKKIKQFAIDILTSSKEESNEVAVLNSELQSIGVWGVQRFNSILQAISNKKPFAFIVGFKPSHFHLGHLTLIREVVWYLQKGGTPIVITSGYEAKKRVSSKQSRIQASMFWRIVNRLSNQSFPDPEIVLSDTEEIGINIIENAICKEMRLNKIKQLYGWENDIPLSNIITPVRLAASFLYAQSIFKDKRPVVVLADINQVSHGETIKLASRITKNDALAISYRILLPSLRNGSQRMSSKEKSTIYIDDDVQSFESKLYHGFTGGRSTQEEQRRIGGNPLICSFFRCAELLLSDLDLNSMLNYCTNGLILCSECKQKNLPQMSQLFVGLSR